MKLHRLRLYLADPRSQADGVLIPAEKFTETKRETMKADTTLYLSLLLSQLKWAGWNRVCRFHTATSHLRPHHGVSFPGSRLAVSKQTHVVALRRSGQHRHAQVLEHLRNTNTHIYTSEKQIQISKEISSNCLEEKHR